jgi:hypothetical protein
MERYLCIHAHFYQPPRENPWLETVELQDSAYPYHDWNERVSAECYAPNAASRILDGAGRIRQIVNNYARISFNFGPTLLSWMEDKAPETYQAVLEADKASSRRFSGHGSALAQAYNHMILPLASERDKYTQALWGIRDFERRFGRVPEGMWLPETAVDTSTLEVLAELGIKFTILAQAQASRVRRTGGRSWKDVSGGRIDPSRAYLARLPSGKQINLFFYDGPISQAVAFEKLLNNGEEFFTRLLGGLNDKRDWPQLMNIATDGETYGHHHRYGDMALAFALDKIEHTSGESGVRLTNYGEFLEKFPPQMEVQIAENTSWSCYHGVERWRSNCGCNSGRGDWNQEWRGPLREALDYLRERAAGLFEQHAAGLLNDPWSARNDYIDVILDRSPESRWRFFEKHAQHRLSEDEIVTALKLLELERHAMLMYTSCGWFFDEISGIETVQVLQYAARVIQLARETAKEDLEQDFLERLARAKSNIATLGDGARLFQAWVKPAMVDLHKAGAHFAISLMFDGDHETPQLCFEVDTHDYRRAESGGARLGLGRARISSRITLETRELTFAAAQQGDQTTHAGVRDSGPEEDYLAFAGRTLAAFSAGEFADTLRELNLYFGELRYSLKSLFKDEQKRIIAIILAQTLADAEAGYHAIYAKHGPMLRFLKEMDQPAPEVLRMTAAFVLNTDLKRAFAADPMDGVQISVLLELVKREAVQLEEAGVAFAARNSLDRLMRRLQREPRNPDLLEQANVLAGILRTLPFAVDLWNAQNIFYSLLQTEFPAVRSQQDAAARTWMERFAALGEKLQVAVPEMTTPAELPRAA